MTVHLGRPLTPPKSKLYGPRFESGRSTILVVLHEPILGGATRSLLRVVPALEVLGWRFAFWAPQGGESAAWLLGEGYVVEGAPRYAFSSVRALRLDPGPLRRTKSLVPYARHLRRYAGSIDPVLIHLNSVTTLAEGIALRRGGPPMLIHVHEMLPMTRKGALAARLCSELAAEVVAVSASCAERLSRDGWTPRIVHESAPIPTAPRPDPGARPLRVGSVGVISRRKGTDIYVEAARLVKERAPEVEFELIGAPSDPLDARWADDVLARATEVGIRHRLRGDVGEAMTSWDMFVLPSRSDPFPIAMLEAMGLGLACVGSEVDGLVEQLGGGAGLLVPGNDPAALADAVLEMRQNPSKRSALGVAARARVIERHTPERQAAGLDSAYRAAIGLGAQAS